MSKKLLGQKIAVLVANGFNETDFTGVQRALQDTGADMKMVSMGHGLVNSWKDSGWGLNFPADQALNESLAVDFDALIIPGGQRAMDKLKTTAHSRRFVGGFMSAGKPVVAFSDAMDLLEFVEHTEGNMMYIENGSAEGVVDFLAADMAAAMKEAA